MVCKHEIFMLAAFKVVPPSLERFNDGQQLSVIDLISNLSRNQIFREKGYRMPLA